jgi:hypothetical protein
MKAYMLKHPEHGLLTWASGETEFIAWSIYLSSHGLKINDENRDRYKANGFRMVPVEITETGAERT